MSLPTDPETLKAVLALSEKVIVAKEKAIALNRQERALLGELHTLASQGEAVYAKMAVTAEKQAQADTTKRAELEAMAAKYMRLDVQMKKWSKTNDLTTKKQLQGYQEVLRASGKYEGQLKVLEKAESSVPAKSILAARARGKSTKDMAQSMLLFTDMTAGTMKTAFNTAFTSIDEQLSGYTAATGLYSEAMRTSFLYAQAPMAATAAGIEGMDKALHFVGITSEDVNTAMKSLTANASGYAMSLHDITQIPMAAFTTNLIAGLSKLGLTTETSSKTLDILNKSLKMPPALANKTLTSFVSLADSLKMNLNVAVEKFNSLMPTLAQYGDRAVDVFAQMAVQARATGIGLDKLNSMAVKLDTFEGAASAAGKLNAALGGTHLSVMELVHADPAEKFELIKEAVANAGLSFEDLDRRQQQVIANAAGFADVGMASRMFGSEEDFQLTQDRMDAAAKSPEELMKRINEAMKIPDKMKSTLGELAPAMGELVEVGRDVADAFSTLPIGTFKLLKDASGSAKASLIAMTAAGETFADKFDAVFSKKVLAAIALISDGKMRGEIEGMWEDLIPPEGLGEFEVPGLGKINVKDMIGTAAEKTVKILEMLNGIFEKMLEGAAAIGQSVDAGASRYKTILDRTAGVTPRAISGPAPVEAPSVAERAKALSTAIGQELQVALNTTVEKTPAETPQEVVLQLDGEVLARFAIEKVKENQERELKTFVSVG